MPAATNDYDPNDPESDGLSDAGVSPGQSAAIKGGSGGAGATAPHEAPTGGGEQQGYVPWQSFVNANADVSQREAGKLQGQVEGDVSKAQGDLTSAQNNFNSGVDANSAQPAAPAAPTKAKKSEGTQQQAAPAAQSDALTSAAAPQIQRNTAQAAQAPTGATPGADQGNPWASFLPPSNGQPPTPPTPQQKPQGLGAAPVGLSQGLGTSAAPSTASAALGGLVSPTSRIHGLTGAAAAGSPTGSHDLESAAGAAPWQTLIGDTNKAGAEAYALGSESGVESLLQQNQTAPLQGNSDPSKTGAFDAALVNGQGQKGFLAENQKYGNNQLQNNVVGAEKSSQDRWKQLQGDSAARNAMNQQMQSPAVAAALKDRPSPQKELANVAPPTDAEKGELNQLLFNGNDENAWSAMHQAGMNMNPADWATIGMGEAGVDVPPTTEIFAGGYGKTFTGGKVNESWAPGKFLMAYQELVHGPPYDGPAKQAFLDHLKATPADLQHYLGMQNPGFMARNMRAWMQSWLEQQRQTPISTVGAPGGVHVTF